MPHKPPRILATHTVAKSRLFHIESVDLEFSNGVTTQYERLKSSGTGAVLIVPMQSADTVLMIREYAVGTECYELCLPKGRMEPGESIETAANRELMEEIQFGARKLQHLTSLSLAPGYLGHKTHIVLAQDLYPQAAQGDEPETLEVVPWSLKELDKLWQCDDFSEARSLAALYLVRDFLTQSGDL